MSLELKTLSAAYDGYPVVSGVSLSLGSAEAAGVVGPNGVGKSTLFKAVMSLTPKKWGKVIVLGEDVTSLPTYRLVRKGLTLVPEGRRVFARMTVRENLEVGAYALGANGALRRRLESLLESMPLLGGRQGQLAGSLSGGEQQLLVIARGLMSNPKILLIDEPFLGLAPASIELVRRALEVVRRNGVGLLIAEEDPALLDGVVDRTYDLSRGAT
jgi:branched-chain amino acid transport system ATP-binding protein